MILKTTTKTQPTHLIRFEAVLGGEVETMNLGQKII